MKNKILSGLLLLPLLLNIADAATITKEQHHIFKTLLGTKDVKCITNKSPFVCMGWTRYVYKTHSGSDTRTITVHAHIEKIPRKGRNEEMYRVVHGTLNRKSKNYTPKRERK